MATMTGAERIFKALEIQEPDRVPFIEGPNENISRYVIEEVLGGDATGYDAMEYFDLDAVMLDDRNNPVWRVENLNSDGTLFKNQWGTINRVASQNLPHPVEGAVKSEKDLDTWRPPDPDDPRRYEPFRKMVNRYKGQKAIGASFSDPFNISSEIRGAANYYMDFVRNPDLVDRLSELIRDYYLRYITNSAFRS